MKEKTCAFTGHRPQKLPFGFNEADERCTALKKLLRTKIIEYIETEHVTHFISGMALGTDMYAAEIVLGLKAAYPGITLTCALPCESQAEKWPEPLRDRYPRQRGAVSHRGSRAVRPRRGRIEGQDPHHSVAREALPQAAEIRQKAKNRPRRDFSHHGRKRYGQAADLVCHEAALPQGGRRAVEGVSAQSAASVRNGVLPRLS